MGVQLGMNKSKVESRKSKVESEEEIKSSELSLSGFVNEKE